MSEYIALARASIRAADFCLERATQEDVNLAAFLAVTAVTNVMRAALERREVAALENYTVNDLNVLHDLFVKTQTIFGVAALKEIHDSVKLCIPWAVAAINSTTFAASKEDVFEVTNAMSRACDISVASMLSPECKMAMETLGSMGLSEIPVSFVMQHTKLDSNPMLSLPDIIIAWKSGGKRLSAGHDLIP